MTKRLLALTAMLLAAYLLVSQGFAMTVHGDESMAGACVLDVREVPDCARLRAQGSCASMCISSLVGQAAIPDPTTLPSSFSSRDPFPHSGRVRSGPEPFPPKFSAES